MIKSLKQSLQQSAAKIVATSLGLSAMLMGLSASATLDANNTNIASTTINTLTSTFTDYLLYVIPGVLVIFLIFWGFKFVLRWMRKFAH